MRTIPLMILSFVAGFFLRDYSAAIAKVIRKLIEEALR